MKKVLKSKKKADTKLMAWHLPFINHLCESCYFTSMFFTVLASSLGATLGI